MSEAAQSASKPQRLSSDGEYIKGTVEEISAEDAQKQFDALKTDLVEAGVPGAEKLQFVNEYARDLNGLTATNEKYSFMSQDKLFGNQLGGSVAAEVINGVPTLYRQAFSTSISAVRTDITTWKTNLNFSRSMSSKFIGLHELGHVSRSGGSSRIQREINANNWALERM